MHDLVYTLLSYLKDNIRKEEQLILELPFWLRYESESDSFQVSTCSISWLKMRRACFRHIDIKPLQEAASIPHIEIE